MKFIKTFLKVSLVIVIVIAFFLLPVTSKQGINYEVKTITMPLGIKIIEFIDRDYNYRLIVREVTRGVVTPQEKVLALFNWTHNNIKRTPAGFPVVDDHVLNIIIRGYGARDQFSDVFAALCNYAGIESFFAWVYTQDKKDRIALSFLRIGGRWRAFDPFEGVYFKDRAGDFADIQTLKKGTYSIEGSTGQVDYSKYFPNLPDFKEMGLGRSNIQSPLNRLLFEIKKHLK